MGFLARLLGREPSFERDLLGLIERDPRFESVERDRERREIRVKLKGGEAVVIGLGNFEFEYRHIPRAERPAFLRRSLAMTGLPEVPSTFAAARDQILPIVRSADLLAHVLLSSRARGEKGDAPREPWPSRSLCEGLAAYYAFDYADAMRHVDGQQRSEWSVTEDDLWDTALTNLKRRTPDPPRPIHEGLFSAGYDDSYDSSRALLDDWVASAPIAGSRLVAIPTRDSLLIGGLAQAELLLRVAEKTAAGMPRPISRRLYVSLDGRLEPFSVGPQSALFQPLKRARELDRKAAYDDQASLLAELHKRENRDIFVAPYKVVRTDAGEYYSWSSWAKDVHAYLPEPDVVFFGHEGGGGKWEQLASVRWSDVIDVVGHRLERVPDLVPPRWATPSFPDAGELEALKRRAIA